MKKMDLGQTIGILANVGVIAGIIFLALQLRQNNELMARQDRFNQLSAQAESQLALAQNSELAGALARANHNGELTPDEEASLEYYVRSVFTKMQWTYRELPESELPVERWRKIGEEPYRQRFWETNRDEFDPDFVEYWNHNVLSRAAQ